ncbi:MAG: glycosyltransferase family 2 protein [Gemmatimonadaceae bacterium]|nr:glycosyltransferase family 2 protein [Acetobacteraceae bacterium]
MPTHLVLIPSYNTGPRVLQTLNEARAEWAPIWVVTDGSTDGTPAALLQRSASDAAIRVIVRPANGGKGAAVQHALQLAAAEGFTHALVMDADGQHPPGRIQAFMAASAADRSAMVLGVPVFGPDAPLLRVRGRRISNWWAGLETLWGGVGDSLCGFRVYPIEALLHVMRQTRWMRRFDFDPEAVVRLYWRGVRPINLEAPVRYLRAEEGGVSHFKYGRDNVLLTWMHVRLMVGFLLRLPLLAWRRAGAAAPP